MIWSVFSRRAVWSSPSASRPWAALARRRVNGRQPGHFTVGILPWLSCLLGRRLMKANFSVNIWVDIYFMYLLLRGKISVWRRPPWKQSWHDPELELKTVSGPWRSERSERPELQSLVTVSQSRGDRRGGLQSVMAWAARWLFTRLCQLKPGEGGNFGTLRAGPGVGRRFKTTEEWKRRRDDWIGCTQGNIFFVCITVGRAGCTYIVHIVESDGNHTQTDVCVCV